MQKTELITIDMDLIGEELYLKIISEFRKTRRNVVYVNEIKIQAIVEFEE